MSITIETRLQSIHRELQSLYYRRDAEQRGLQLHAARLHAIREQLKVAEALREELEISAAIEAPAGAATGEDRCSTQ